jgi:hypothetical protein
VKILCAVWIVLAGAAVLRAEPDSVVDRFSAATEPGSSIPKGWKELKFSKIPKTSEYTVEGKDGEYWVKAVSRASASGILKEVRIDPSVYPVLAWKWKVDGLLQKSDPYRKSGDDYPARIYVAFEYAPSKASLWERGKYGAIKLIYGQYPPKGVLNYVWDTRTPKGATLDNPYTDRAKMIVVESGPEKVGQWVSAERNVYEDYRKLFGGEPPRIAFIAVMTDTDNTGESASAAYDDLVFRPK